MTEADIVSPIQETSELTFMKSKYPNIKQKLSQPFPYFYQPPIKDEQFYNTKLIEFKAKLQQTQPNFNDELVLFQALALGKIQGMPGVMTPWQQLSYMFEYDKRDYWTQFLKDKVSVKNYGLPKQKQYSIWEVKDIEQLKDIYNIDQIKKQRKIIKQFSSYYKACYKFVQKFDKLQKQEQIAEIYEEYKKVQQEQSKMNKVNSTEKTKVVKIVAPLVSKQSQTKVVSNDKQNQNQQRKVQNIPVQSNRIVDNNPVSSMENIKPSEADQKVQPKTPKTADQGKNSKKKVQVKEPISNKKQVKTIKDKIVSKNMSLDLFFKKKQPEQSQTKPKQNEMINEQQTDKTDIFFQSLGFNQPKQNIPSILDLKTEFISKRKIIQNQIKACYVSIYMTRSRLQLTDFPVKQMKVDFTDPYSQKENIRYDDSSDEYSELVADSINEEMVQQQEEQQDMSESNSAIVSDSFCQYKSSHVFSSSESEEQQQGQKLKPQMTKSMGKWFFSINQLDRKDRASKYEMICLIDDTMPMIVREQAEENNNEVSSLQKIEMYKQIHGSYTPKQVLIKKINSIVENKISMNKLSTLIKDICEKKGTQRVIKTQMIRQLAQELAETYPNLQVELEQLRSQRQSARNQEAQAKRQQKINERDQKLEKLILEYNGPMTTALILQYLRTNEMKLIKQQLNNIIKNKQGQKWDEIRAEIKKNKLVKQGRPKKIKQQKQNEEQNLKNTHRPIDQILKQNQIQMMNKPKKEKKKVEGQMVNQGGNEVQYQEEPEQQYHEPSDDESFDLKDKSSKKSKSKKKSIVKIAPLLPPVRRNPKRNRKKTKRYGSTEEVKQPVQQNEVDNEQQPVDCVQQKKQQLEPENVNIDDLNNLKKINQNEELMNNNEINNMQASQNKVDQLKNNEMVEVNNPEIAVTPIKILKEQQKNNEQNNQKTANKQSLTENNQQA